MKTLSDHQKEFLLTKFFENEKFPGWRNIGTTLLEEGECIVAGSECIWVGGIGNFIKTETAKNAIGCLIYKFDIESFLKSAWYKQIKNNHVSILSDKKREIEKEHEEICGI